MSMFPLEIFLAVSLIFVSCLFYVDVSW